MAEIQLKKAWASYAPNAIVRVSEERADYLVNELGIARRLDEPQSEPDPQPKPQLKPEPEPEKETKKKADKKKEA